MNKTHFGHVNIITKDWKKLSKFYIDVFNCALLPNVRDLKGPWLDRATGIENSKIKGVHLEFQDSLANGPTLEIFEYSDIETTSSNNLNTLGFRHIAFQTNDIEAIVSKVINGGGKICGEIAVNYIPKLGFMQFVYVKDIDGNFIEVQTWHPKYCYFRIKPLRKLVTYFLTELQSSQKISDKERVHTEELLQKAVNDIDLTEEETDKLLSLLDTYGIQGER